jgi:CheY-like chemotaxis protein
MPIKDGITATKEIREYFESIDLKREDQPKIIGVTGHVLEDFYRQGHEAGMDEIVAKPLYIQILSNLLAKYHVI